MKGSLIAYLAVFLNGGQVGFSEPPTGFPPDGSWPITQGPSLPGASKGETACYWIAPYVTASEVFDKTTVTWFAEDGRVKRQSAVSGIQPGFVTMPEHKTMPDWLVNGVDRFGPRFDTLLQSHEVVRGVNEGWQIALPNKSGPPGYLTSSRDSRVFVHEYHPKQGLIALDIYVHGKRVNTVGPLRQYQGSDVELNEDGSAGLLVWKDESKTNMEIVALNANGLVRFQSDCAHEFCSPIVAPDGAGVLLRSYKGGIVQNSFTWFTEQGLERSIGISPNPECAGWIPGSRKSLFWTSVGDPRRYQLIDWDTGKPLWDIPCPGGGAPLAIGLTPRLIIFAVAEPDQRAFYAVSVQDGALVARWQERLPQRMNDSGHDAFLWLGKKLFYVTSAEVSELELGDIFSKKNGWR